MHKKQEARRITALNGLHRQMDMERESRANLQAQSFNLVVPSDNELRIARERRLVKLSLGHYTGEILPIMQSESPF